MKVLVLVKWGNHYGKTPKSEKFIENKMTCIKTKTFIENTEFHWKQSTTSLQHSQQQTSQ